MTGTKHTIDLHSPSAVVPPFAASIERLFKTMLKSPVSVGTPFPKTAAISHGDVSAVVGFSGQAAGCAVLVLPRAVACVLVRRFSKREYEFGGADFCDAIGELINMIAGGAKKDLGNGISMTVPNVIVGAGHTLATLTDAPTTVIPCTICEGEFALEVSLKSSDRAAVDEIEEL